MSEKYKFSKPDGIYFVSITVVHWIDLFSRKELKHVILDSIKYCQKSKGLVIHAWVLMSSHLHMIISTEGEPLQDIIRDFKKYTSKRLVQTISLINESRKKWLLRAFEKSALDLKRVKSHKVWLDGNHPVLLDTNNMKEERLQYIHFNPVEAELVDEPAFYWYSSARDYAGQKGLLDIRFL